MHQSQTVTTVLILFLTYMVRSAESANRFQEWFPSSKFEFADISQYTCNATLQAFESEYNRYSDKAWIDVGIYPSRRVYQLCRDHQSCILQHISEAEKASLGISNVFLGMLPTLLAAVSPSLAELALLSTRRPLLAFLTSIGAPAILKTRIFEYEDPGLLQDVSRISAGGRSVLALGPWSKRSAFIAGIAEYVLILASVVNTISLALQLSNRAIIGWGCTRTWPLMVWAFVPSVLHVLAAQGYRLTLKNLRQSDMVQADYVGTAYTFFAQAPRGRKAIQASIDHSAADTTTMTKNSTILRTGPSSDVTKTVSLASAPNSNERLREYQRWFFREWTSCTSHADASKTRAPRDDYSTKVTMGVVLNCLAGFLGFLHLFYATITFSGLVFIDSLDAINQVAMRLLASCVICRFVVLIEVAGLRGAGVVAWQQKG